jgi:acyl-CoA thioesterase
MGDLEADTRPTAAGDGRYTAQLSDDWNIWGPNGGYVASVALRAAGMECGLPRPASLSCQFLKPGRFDVPFEMAVTTLRRSKRTAAMRVECTQEGTRVLEAQVWGVSDVPGLEHDHAPMAHPGDPLDLPTIAERFAAIGEEAEPPFVFWENFDNRPIGWVGRWEEREAGEPEAGGWYRYTPTATFEDPWADACRSVILADTFSWPCIVRAHTFDEVEEAAVIAPSLDLHVQLHHPAADQEWLQVWGRAPVSQRGSTGFTSQVWAQDGRLAAVGSGALLYVPVRA